MAFISASDLQPLFEHVSASIRPSQPTTSCSVANAIYWSLRVDGEVGNGGLAQLVWNLHDQYDPATLADALRDIGANDAADLVNEAFLYVDGTPVRKQRFFAKGPFGAAKPLVRLTNRYHDLVPDVSSLVTTFVDDNWDVASFQEVIVEAGLADIRRVELSDDDIRNAIDSADGTALLAMVRGGLDPNARDEHDKTLLTRIIGYTDKVPARVQILEQLVAAGADLQAVDDSGETVLSNATTHGGAPAYLRCLIGLGADVNHVGSRGETPVFGATEQRESLEVLLDAGASLTHRADDGSSPLGAVLSSYSWWFQQKDNPHRGEYLTRLLQSIDLLLERGAALSTEVITVGYKGQRHTELGSVIEDPALLARLLTLSSTAEIPDITGGGAWAAMHEASQTGSHTAIRTLGDDGRIMVNAALTYSDLERDAFAGATPLDVAADEATANLLVSYGAAPGHRSSHDVYLTSRADETADLVGLVSELPGFDTESATTLIELTPTEIGKTISYDADGDLVLLSPKRIALCTSESDALRIADRATSAGATTAVL